MLTIEREGREPFDVEIVRAVIITPEVEYEEPRRRRRGLHPARRLLATTRRTQFDAAVEGGRRQRAGRS